MGLGAAAKDQALIDKIASLAEGDLQEAYSTRQKQLRSEKLSMIADRVSKQLVQDAAEPAR